jgi:hypothetical protein
MPNKDELIAKSKDLIKVGFEGLREAGVKLGAGDLRALVELTELHHAEGVGLSAKHRQEEESTSLFDKMSSAELMELYQTDRPKWQQVIDSVQSAGERKLEKLQSR